MQEYLDEMIESRLHEVARRALSVLTRDGISPNPSNCIVTTSSGASVTVIPYDSDYVLQSFISPGIFLRIKDFWNVIQARRDPHLIEGLAAVLEFYDDLLTIRVQKVIPLNNFTVIESGSECTLNTSKIYKDIGYTLELLSEHGLVHGDPRIDNIGINPETGRYVLFDYDQVMTNLTRIDSELRMLQNSISYHLSYRRST